MPSINRPAGEISPFGAAILKLVNELYEPDRFSYCTFSDLEELEEEFDGYVVDEVLTLVEAGHVWVPTPYGAIDWDTSLLPVTWHVGQSTIAEITADWRNPHIWEMRGDERVLTYDLDVRVADEGHPPPPAPYKVRNEQHEARPEGCTFPFANIWPTEALKLEFVFDHSGLLQRYRYKVGPELP